MAFEDASGRRASNQHQVLEVRSRRWNGEELREEPLVLHERDRRLGVVGHVLDLLGRRVVVPADRRPAGVHDAQVCNHVLRYVAGHDQPELPRPETQRTQCQRDRPHLVPVALPRQGSPLPVDLPVQSVPVTPLRDRVREYGADRLAGDRLIDGFSLRDHTHAHTLQVSWTRARRPRPRPGNTLLAGGAGLIYVRARRSIVTLAVAGLAFAPFFGALGAVAMGPPTGWGAPLPPCARSLGRLL